MIEAREVFWSLAGVLLVSVAGRADISTVYRTEVECRQVERTCSKVKDRPIDLTGILHCPGAPTVNCWAVPFISGAAEDFGQTSRTQGPHILTDGQSSLNLYLSALISLGLCSSAHCLKKLHSGFISEWHYNGGPFQVGHSIAVDPDSVCPAPVCAFIQSAHPAEDYVPQYRLGAIVSLWRKSQFIVTVLAPRGPPRIS